MIYFLFYVLVVAGLAWWAMPSQREMERAIKFQNFLNENYDYDELSGRYYPNQKYQTECWNEIVEAFKKSKHYKIK